MQLSNVTGSNGKKTLKCGTCRLEEKPSTIARRRGTLSTGVPKGYLEVSIILLVMEILDYILRPYYSVYYADIMLRLMATLLCLLR